MDDRMAEHPDQNWSAVCQEGVAKRLTLLADPQYQEACGRVALLKHTLEVAERLLDELEKF
jgi:hypothetical protein